MRRFAAKGCQKLAVCLQAVSVLFGLVHCVCVLFLPHRAADDMGSIWTLHALSDLCRQCIHPSCSPETATACFGGEFASPSESESNDTTSARSQVAHTFVKTLDVMNQ